MSITAIVHNDTIKLPVHVPDGTEVEITLPSDAEAAGNSVDPFAAVIGAFAGPKDATGTKAEDILYGDDR